MFAELVENLGAGLLIQIQKIIIQSHVDALNMAKDIYLDLGKSMRRQMYLNAKF